MIWSLTETSSGSLTVRHVELCCSLKLNRLELIKLNLHFYIIMKTFYSMKYLIFKS